MKKPGRKTSGFGVGILIALIAVLLLVVQARQAAMLVRKQARPADLRSDVASSPGTAMLAQLSLKDALLSQEPDLARDPFRDPTPPPRPAGSSTRVPPKPAPVVTPVLRAVLIDDTGKGTIQLSAGGRESGWLHPGEVFEGWKIEDIRPNAVTISREGVSTVLNNVTHSS